MTRYLLDTNVLLRFLLADDEKQLPAVKRLFQHATEGRCVLVLGDVALAEAVWVLSSFYKLDRKPIAESLAKIITKPGIHCPNVDTLLDALARYQDTNCDFFDCYLASQAAAEGDGIASFDQDFRKFEDVHLWDWDANGQ